ncbi:uncharacterized protein BO97DRAFT_389431 [Aspergillus homomorphus CBS 101889]|uniref:Leucine-rich repeat protein n=1 Tax=Aspergillus homomorphus (strain CBS 101889) TaxID=1450537 RepID=A0A395HYF5_ASPHC|nr:hypothetical protein BO97DRAFT_389431 [Aspergillus homomorphus CBS 101889]RAL12961.1 hypothetical protein BO97DRAFT_389431 [Aspergillus homomorphus CBS 101889]
MSDNLPWLENLLDDWVPVPAPGTPDTPGTPNSPVPSRSFTHSRQSSLQNSPSRIPVPARRSAGPSRPSLDSFRKKVSRPCHFIKREPPTPKTPRTPKTPSKLRSPLPLPEKSTKKSPNPISDPPSLRKQQSAMDTRSPLRSVSNASGESEQQSTVQVRPKKGKGKDGTPEWRRRLVQGAIPAGEQRDLFAPIGLESVFKPPTPGTEKTQDEAISRLKQSDSLWHFTTPHSYDDTNFGDPHSPELSPKQAESAGSPKSSSNGTVAMRTGSKQSLPDRGDHLEVSVNNNQQRTASGLEDLRNEDFTPITFTRTNTVDGQATSEVIKSALKQVTNKLERLHLSPGDRPESRASDSLLIHQQPETAVDALPEDDLLDVTSNSLPKDLSMGTLDYRGRGAFADLRREEYANDGSFQRIRLSPPPFPSERLSPFLPASSRIRSSPPFYQKANPITDPPTLPRPSSAHVGVPKLVQSSADRPEAMPSSGSPLKLFGNHDTFTNNHLLRRMSQFEETFGGLSEDDEPVSPSEEARRKGESRSFLTVNHEAVGEQPSRRHERPRSRNTPTPRINRFGDGQLDNFDFSDTSPYEPKFLNNEAVESTQQPQRRQSVERRYIRRRSYRQNSHSSDFSKSNRGSRSTALSDITSSAKAIRNQGLARVEEMYLSETDSSLNTPAKDPTPKRRRTFLRSYNSRQEPPENPGQNPDNMSLLQRSLVEQGLRYEDDQSSLRSQSSPRPRTPTPSQLRSASRKRPSSGRAYSRAGYAGSTDQDSPADSAIPMVRVNGINEGGRKGSITTQDFLNEATKIMDIIRSKGRSAGGLSSVEESDAEDVDESGSYEDESTREEFSRPPSRDGADMRRLREPQQQSPRILSHLKRFQEEDDQEFGVNASAMSLNLHHDQEHSDDDNNEDDDLPELLTINTQVSSKSLSARSVPTGSSQSSHAKGVLSSDVISRLIPEQVNGLVYDRDKNQWVREKPKPTSEKPKGEDSEDDPFKDIPDLSVDELQEMMRMQSSASPERTKDSTRLENDQCLSPLSSSQFSTKSSLRPPQFKASGASVDGSSVHSKDQANSKLSDSETKATSWGTDARKASKSVSEIEHEIQLHEGRLSKPPRRLMNGRNQARVVTISFSSPLVSQVAYSDDESPAKLLQARGNLQPPLKSKVPGNSPLSFTQPQKNLLLPQPESPDNKVSLPNRTPTRDTRTTREKSAEALSLVRRGIGSTDWTPQKDNADTSLACLEHNGQETTYSFHLSPLPDFTVDQIDPSLHLEVSYVAQRTHPTSLRQVHGTFALATEELIKHITEAEPWEPHWEHVRRLVLRHKGLLTLHKLCDFCPRLEDLDVCGNAIGQLSGVPSTLRTLNIQDNCLSNLTAWGHLMNLQYLDVSGNELESLNGFSSLIHLRELKANDNNLKDISGIYDLDGLLSLQLRNNELEELDFGRAELTRLETLDLSHNQLTSIRNISALPSLTAVDLRSNKLYELSASATLFNLQSLKVSNNVLRSIDISMFPSLTLLYADQNFLSTISGLGTCRSLEVLSARDQMSGSNGGLFEVDLGLTQDIRKVFLSSNRLAPRCLAPSNALLSLQLLDIASCSLQVLPEDFASSFPNVAVLNLNFNSLQGVNELVGMKCLSRLAIAGNNITRLRRLCQVLGRIGRTNRGKLCSLQKIDTRGNPLTLRFYPTAVIDSGKATTKKLKAKEDRPQRTQAGLDIPSALAEFRDDFDTDHLTVAREDDKSDDSKEVEVHDPYTLPLADPLADQKHLSHLDESTRLRRSVFELMLYAGSGGSIKILDGLELRPSLEEGSDMNRAWARLEKLGVLKRKAITA